MLALYSFWRGSFHTEPEQFSGDVDLVLLELEPKTAPVGTFDLKVKGAGFPAQTTKQTTPRNTTDFIKRNA